MSCEPISRNNPPLDHQVHRLNPVLNSAVQVLPIQTITLSVGLTEPGFGVSRLARKKGSCAGSNVEGEAHCEHYRQGDSIKSSGLLIPKLLPDPNAWVYGIRSVPVNMETLYRSLNLGRHGIQTRILWTKDHAQGDLLGQ